MREEHVHSVVTTSVSSWTECIDPEACAADKSREEAHGEFLILDMCACGAIRQRESNRGRTNFGVWKEPKREAALESNSAIKLPNHETRREDYPVTDVVDLKKVKNPVK